MSSTTEVRQQGGRFNRWLGLTVLMLPVLLVTVDNTVLGFALPKIAEALHPTASQQLWIIDAYSLVLAGLLVSMGSLVTAHYRGALHLPSFLTPAQERLASETLAGAHSVAAALTGDQASELMSIAGNAFEGGIGLMSWVTFALAVIGIAIARWALRVS